LEQKEKEEEDTKEATSEKMIQERAKQVSLLEEDEDETIPIINLIRKQEIVVDLVYKGKTKEQKIENKDETICMEREWVGTIMRKMIDGAIALKVKHPIFIEKGSVKPYSKNIMVHMMFELEYVFCLVAKFREILFVALFSSLFEGRSSTTSTRRTYY
jgi:hypothetical protein